MSKISFTLPKVWSRFFSLLKQYPVIFTPFILAGIVDGLILAVIFLSPRPPFSIVFGPILKAFWGEQFLHYPANFLILPTLYNYGKNIATFITGLIFSGVTISMIFQASQRAKPEWLIGFSKAFKKYPRLILVWGVTFVLTAALVKVINKLEPIHSTVISISLEFISTMVVQMLFMFAIPAILIENRKTFFSLLRSLAIIRHFPVTSFLIVFIPSLLVIPLTFLHVKLPMLMRFFSPEAVLWVLSARVITVTIIDFLLTGMAAVMLIIYRENENKGFPL